MRSAWGTSFAFSVYMQSLGKITWHVPEGFLLSSLITIQFLSSGFGILRVDSYFQTFVWGAVLVGDMILNYCLDKLAENRKKKKAEKENA